MEQANSILKEYGFPKFIDISRRYSISDIISKKFCGIYILRFSDSSYYIGQSVDIGKRFLQHKKKYNDIEAITFKRVNKIELDNEEQVLIGIMENIFNLRNISLTTLPKISDCELDEIITPAQQEEWLSNSNPQLKICERVDDPRLRSRTKKRCEQLLKEDNFKINFLPVMQKYIKLCIPEPYKTEITFWGCSCLPAYDSMKIRYSRINLRFQEVFTAYHEVSSLTNMICWHLARSPFTEAHLKEIIQLGEIMFDDHKYPSGGADQFRICAFDLQSGLSLLDNPIFVYAAKIFNLSRMRSGAQPYSRYHAPALADELLIG